MKIHDIISESSETNEGVKSWLAKTAVKGLEMIGKGPSRDAAEELAAYWSKQMHYGQALTPADQIIGKFAKDPKVIKAAEQEAAVLAKAAKEAAISKAAQQGYRNAADGLLFVGKLGVGAQLVVQPATQYFTVMRDAEARLKTGELSDTQYAAIRQQQMSLMTGRILANIAASYASYKTLKPLITTLRKVGASKPGGPANVIADMLETLKVAGVSYIANNITNNGAFGKLVASLMSYDIAQEVAGGYGVQGLDELKQLIGAAQASDKVGKTDYSKPDAAAPAKAATSTAPTPAYNSTSQATSPNQIKDPVTGEVRIRYPDEY